VVLTPGQPIQFFSNGDVGKCADFRGGDVVTDQIGGLLGADRIAHGLAHTGDHDFRQVGVGCGNIICIGGTAEGGEYGQGSGSTDGQFLFRFHRLSPFIYESSGFYWRRTVCSIIR
jgi:hypothetical protein